MRYHVGKEPKFAVGEEVKCADSPPKDRRVRTTSAMFSQWQYVVGALILFVSLGGYFTRPFPSNSSKLFQSSPMIPTTLFLASTSSSPFRSALSSSPTSRDPVNVRYTNPHLSIADNKEQAAISWSMQSIDHMSLDYPYTEEYIQVYRCRIGERQRVDLPATVKQKLWFRTQISTNLNILLMGDSVAMQIGELLQEAMQIPPHQRQLLRSLYPGEDDRHESLFWGNSPHSGGGSGGWRILNMWLRRYQEKPLPEAPGGGWTRNDTKTLMYRIQRYDQSAKSTNQREGFTIKKQPKVDVVVFRISQPWMNWHEISEFRMNRTVRIAREELGASMVVFVTIPFANNVVDFGDMEEMHEKNEMIHRFARDYPSMPYSMEDMTVSTWDLGRLSNELVQANAREMGYTVHDRLDFMFGLETLFQIRPPNSEPEFSRSIGHVCGPPMVPHDSLTCANNNMITVDGQHLCMQTYGGRMMAGLACVIRCGKSFGGRNGYHAKMLECQDACNEVYMSLNDIDRGWFLD